MTKKQIVLLVCISCLVISCLCFPISSGSIPVPSNTSQANSGNNPNPSNTSQASPGNNNNPGGSGQPYTIGISTCNRVPENQWMGIGTNGVSVSTGWKGYQCPIWVQARKDIGLKMSDLFLPLGGTADFSQQGPYQQGSFYVMTSDNVKYPVDLETLEYGYSNDVPIFPGAAVTGRFYSDPSVGGISLINTYFGFLIPESMTAQYIVYTQNDQHINIPTDGQVSASSEIQGDFIAQLPVSITLDQYITVQIFNPTLTPYDNGVMFSLTVSGSNSDASATHDFVFPIGVVDSNNVSWNSYSCTGSLGPSQTSENQCNVAVGLYSTDQLPAAIYFGIDGSSQTYFFKLAIDQIAH